MNISQVLATTNLGWRVLVLESTPPPEAPETAGPWRPPQWDKPQLTSLVVPQPNNQPAVTFFFDGVMRINHRLSARPTEHPVQTGANIVDHVYIRAAEVSLEILESDAMDRVQPGMFTSDPSKSVSAFRSLKIAMENRIPVTVNTRLFRYTNMIIREVIAPDDVRTRHALRAFVVLQQIFTADVTLSTQPISSRPQVSNATQYGTKQVTTPPPAAVTAQHNVTKLQPQIITNVQATPKPLFVIKDIPGAGDWSSDNITNLTDNIFVP